MTTMRVISDVTQLGKSHVSEISGVSGPTKTYCMQWVSLQKHNW